MTYIMYSSCVSCVRLILAKAARLEVTKSSVTNLQYFVVLNVLLDSSKAKSRWRKKRMKLKEQFTTSALSYCTTHGMDIENFDGAEASMVFPWTNSSKYTLWQFKIRVIPV